jgi:hypothetical protein
MIDENMNVYYNCPSEGCTKRESVGNFNRLKRHAQQCHPEQNLKLFKYRLVRGAPKLSTTAVAIYQRKVI